MRLRQLALLGGVCVLVVGLAMLPPPQNDPLASLHRTEHRAELLSGGKPEGIGDWITLQWARFSPQKSATELWAKYDLEVEEQVRLGNLARLQVPWTNLSAKPFEQRRLGQISRAGVALYPKTIFIVGYDYLAKSLEITAPPQITNQLIQLIVLPQTAN